MYKINVLANVFGSGGAELLKESAAVLVTGSSNTLMNPIDGVFQIIVLLVVLVGMVFLAHFTTKWMGKSKLLRKGANLDILESRATGAASSIQLVKAGSKYFVIGVTKERVTFLTEVDEISLDLTEKIAPAMPVSFEKIMERFQKKNEGENNSENEKIGK